MPSEVIHIVKNVMSSVTLCGASATKSMLTVCLLTATTHGRRIPTLQQILCKQCQKSELFSVSLLKYLK